MTKKTKSQKSKKISNKLKSTITNVVKVSVNNRRKGKATRTPKAEPQIRYIPQPIFQNSSGDISAINRRLDDIQQGLRYKPPSTTITTQTPLAQPQFQGNRMSPPDLMLSPATSVLNSLERMREYLKDNLSSIPAKKQYSEDEIDALQGNRLQQMYQETKQNLLAHSTPSEKGTSIFGGGRSLFGGSSDRTKKS
jgi:hypothetical protein